jgi:hypothetical protein
MQQEQEARDRSAARKRHLAISQEMQGLALRGLLELQAKAAAGSALNKRRGGRRRDRFPKARTTARTGFPGTLPVLLPP